MDAAVLPGAEYKATMSGEGKTVSWADAIRQRANPTPATVGHEVDRWMPVLWARRSTLLGNMSGD